MIGVHKIEVDERSDCEPQADSQAGDAQEHQTPIGDGENRLGHEPRPPRLISADMLWSRPILSTQTQRFRRRETADAMLIPVSCSDATSTAAGKSCLRRTVRWPEGTTWKDQSVR